MSAALPPLISITATTLLVARAQSPSLVKVGSLIAPFTIFCVVIPFLPFWVLIDATADNPWDELCAGEEQACVHDPFVWVNFILGAWATIVVIVSGPILVIWELMLAARIRQRASGHES